MGGSSVGAVWRVWRVWRGGLDGLEGGLGALSPAGSIERDISDIGCVSNPEADPTCARGSP